MDRLDRLLLAPGGPLNEQSPLTAAPAPATERQGGFAGVVARLTGVNVVVLAAGLVTGPITARALGADGRGELAAILAVLTMAPWVLDLGLSQWVARERARAQRREDVLGAAMPVALGCSLVGVAAAIPLSHLLGDGRSVVVTFLQIGLFLVPVSVALQTLLGLAIGESRWRLYAATRVVASVLPAVAIVVLAVIGELTVASAAASYLACGLLAGLMLLTTVRGVRRLALDRGRARAATAFGAKSWLSTVGGAANNRLDQVLMAGLVPSRELGLYAVAVTIPSVTYGLIVAVSAALFPRVAEGDGELAALSCRVTVCLVSVVGLALALLSPALIPFVFGAEFRDAVPMVIILLFASVPLSVAVILASALAAAGDPAAAMRAELAALALTVPALVAFLPDHGGLAAAVISLVAYTVRLAIQLRAQRRTLGRPARSFLLPTREDVTWLLGRMRRASA